MSFAEIDTRLVCGDTGLFWQRFRALVRSSDICRPQACLDFSLLMLQWVAQCCSILQYTTECCSACSQHSVAVYCSLLQCVAVRALTWHMATLALQFFGLRVFNCIFLRLARCFLHQSIALLRLFFFKLEKTYIRDSISCRKWQMVAFRYLHQMNALLRQFFSWGGILYIRDWIIVGRGQWLHSVACFLFEWNKKISSIYDRILQHLARCPSCIKWTHSSGFLILILWEYSRNSFIMHTMKKLCAGSGIIVHARSGK